MAVMPLYTNKIRVIAVSIAHYGAVQMDKYNAVFAGLRCLYIGVHIMCML